MNSDTRGDTRAVLELFGFSSGSIEGARGQKLRVLTGGDPWVISYEECGSRFRACMAGRFNEPTITVPASKGWQDIHIGWDSVGYGMKFYVVHASAYEADMVHHHTSNLSDMRDSRIRHRTSMKSYPIECVTFIEITADGLVVLPVRYGKHCSMNAEQFVFEMKEQFGTNPQCDITDKYPDIQTPKVTYSNEGFTEIDFTKEQ